VSVSPQTRFVRRFRTLHQKEPRCGAKGTPSSALPPDEKSFRLISAQHAPTASRRALFPVEIPASAPARDFAKRRAPDMRGSIPPRRAALRGLGCLTDSVRRGELFCVAGEGGGGSSGSTESVSDRKARPAPAEPTAKSAGPAASLPRCPDRSTQMPRRLAAAAHRVRRVDRGNPTP